MNRKDAHARALLPCNRRVNRSSSQHPPEGCRWLLGCAAVMLSLSVILVLGGCDERRRVRPALAQNTGAGAENQADSKARSEPAMPAMQQTLTVKQEYYLGRAVAARILQHYAPLDRPQANAYLNLLGQSLAVFSDRPETFAGYRFLLLDSDEINAFGAPGGLILVTRGMIQCCENEDERAAVLAHEICHIQNRDGLRAIQAQHMTEALTVMGGESAPLFGAEAPGLAPEFEALVSAALCACLLPALCRTSSRLGRDMGDEGKMILRSGH